MTYCLGTWKRQTTKSCNSPSINSQHRHNHHHEQEIAPSRRPLTDAYEWAARAIVVVDPKYTSQTYFACKHRAAGSREGARFVCVACGYEEHADINAALNILDKAELRPRSV
ncbi:MAG: zinc ribbon domain-containing protein, partial [Vulcanimicrobiaceae bacterium]